MTSISVAPRWQRIIEEALEEDKNANVYQLATLERTSASRDAIVPRVRSLIHRAFISPRSATHPLLLTTTDARSPKAAQLAQNSHVEIAWWLPQAQAQMRILGTAYVYPAPDFVLTGTETASEEKKHEIKDAVAKLRSLFPDKELSGDGFDWESERRSRFDAMSGHMRASWLRPIPGTSLTDPSSAEKWPETVQNLEDSKYGGGEKSKQVEDALRNFALVVIDPLEIDYVELAVMPNRRTRFFKEGKEWKDEALVP